MRTVTATEASRAFAALLDEVEEGETVIITRGGRRVASIGPAPTGNGSDVIRLLRAHSIDAGFASDVVAARAAVELEAPLWPDD